MKIVRSARMRQKKRWRPKLSDIVRRTFRKHHAAIVANVIANNALMRSLLGGEAQ